MLFIKRKNFLIASILIITFLTFIFCFSAIRKTPIGETNANKIKVVLDAGHGGIDGGVSGINSGVKESELNLAVTKKLESYLVNAGMSVVLTRNTDAGLYGIATQSFKQKDMQKRRDIIKKAKPNLVVSIHMNKYCVSTRRGAQVFYKEWDESSKLLAESIQTSFNEMKEAVRQCSALTGDYYILNCSNFPSVIAECGFLSNPEDDALLVTKEYQDAIAYSLFKGIVNYLTILPIN